MKSIRIIGIVLCLALSFNGAAGAGGKPLQRPAAPDAGIPVDIGDSCSLLMQISNTYAVKNGEKVSITSGLGALLAPYYDGSLSMVPLRFIAEAFGYAVTWEERAQKAAVSGGTANAAFTAGEASAETGGTAVGLGVPAVIQGDSVFVPARAFCRILGLNIHYYDKNDGEFLLITDYPVSAGDRTGDINADFDSAAPDPGLFSVKNLGDDVLGPSRAMYACHTLTLMRGSAHALWGGAEAAVTDPDSGVSAPVFSAEGDLFVPMAYCARCFGTQIDAADYSTLVFNGVIYISAGMFAAAAGLYYDPYSPDIVIFSGYDAEKYDNLATYAAENAARLQKLPAVKGYIAMSFDDGPTGGSTARLLDGLHARHVRATFFLCGDMIELYPDLTARYTAEGHELGNHSTGHPQMTKLSPEAIGAEIDGTSEALAKYGAADPVLFRPPYGEYNQKVLSELERRSMACIMWSVGFEDYLYSDCRPIVDSVVSRAGDGDIIILHDANGASVEAGLQIINTLQEEGYIFLTISDLAFIKGYTLSAGCVYYSF